LRPLVNYPKHFIFFGLSLLVIHGCFANLHIPFFIQHRPVYRISNLIARNDIVKVDDYAILYRLDDFACILIDYEIHETNL